ncbi:uncharacterized protein B0P05DRAFT_586308 [Gilbertella persicaria]|uniref:uncharacterized protein n=1 Tax=Gilbertella persicaria TaxID=101096 RepID=UPI002220EBBA|nr:uncharacterized protein B0P05DRAFT_586308 [Gilbertella persicaria]KAI8082655.1 hypothetical protein B0P05DRAFT_586308 [Gilbertella persicaria]
MDDFDGLFDHDLDLDLLDSPSNHALTSKDTGMDDDFGDDDDLDLNDLVEVTEAVEQQHAVSNGQISFVSFGEHDPLPPPALPSSTPCFHPFDTENLRTWIYPINYPIRGYQFNIVQKAMFHNTLVALPTGLGKTFIAAVVMFNYYRWFPNSKIIFMAPTRPLVEQQIEACFTICGLPQEDTVEMMGSTTPAKRRELWKSKRVFFATPQTIQKDLESSSCAAEKIACIVVDEAHKATGNYAYSEVVRKVSKKNKDFRVLALTATPGSNLDAVQAVVDNLHITNIQIRTEDSMDIREYSHGKNTQHVIVKLSYTEGSTGLLPRIIEDFKQNVLGPLLTNLSKLPINVSADIERTSSFGLHVARNTFRNTAKNVNQNIKWKVFSLCLVAEQAYRAYELLCQHGIAPFVSTVESILQEFNAITQNGKEMNQAQRQFVKNSALQGILRTCKQEMTKPDFVGHPKMDQLVSILLNHFASLSEGKTSRAMVFSSYRNSVQDIVNVLNRHSPILLPSFFVGQASDKHGTKGLKQTEQQAVIQKFKRGEFNVLVSTSIGEEGLDIGEIDLIVCFDSQSSPIRMLQRMGRTGRKRKGKCILLMTESEEKKFQQAKDAYSRIQGLITRGGLLKYYKPNPSVLPNNYKPSLCRKKLDVGVYVPKMVKKRKRGQEQESDYTPEGLLKPEVEHAFIRSFNDQDHMFTSMEPIMERFWPVQRMVKSVNKFIPIQTVSKSVHRVQHSRRTLQFVDLVKKMEHRILHPEEKINFKFSLPKKQTHLHLPSKGKQKKTRPYDSVDLDNQDFAAFMENHDMSQFMMTDDMPTKELVLPTSKKDKGKAKMNPSDEGHVEFNSDADKQMDPLSSDPMLPESVYEEPGLFEDRQKDVQVSVSDTLTPVPDSPSNQHDASDGFSDEFPLDDSFIADALLMVEDVPGFHDPLEPQFPFETNTYASKAISFVWTHAMPEFSRKAKDLLDQRQISMKELTGRFLAMQCFPQYGQQISRVLRDTVETKASSPPKEPPQTKSPVKVMTIKDSQASEHQAQPMEDDDDFDQFDFISDGAFANFLENKFSEDDQPGDFSHFMEEQEASQQCFTQHIMKKSSLYADTSQKQQDNHKEQEEEVFVFDLNEPFSDSDDEEQGNNQAMPTLNQHIENQEDNQVLPMSIERVNNKASLQESSPIHIQQEVNTTPLISINEDSQPRLAHTRKASVLLTSDDETEPDTAVRAGHHRSSSLLSELSRGIYTPSPLRHDIQSSENEASPVLIYRKRRMKNRIIQEDDHDEDGDQVEIVKTRKKRLRQKSSTLSPLASEDDLIIVPPSSHSLLKRLKQSGYNAHHRTRQDHNDELENPFIDVEAEKSSDGGHTTEDEMEEGSSCMDSFIDDASDLLASRISNDTASPARNIYVQSLLHDENPSNRKHWINRFDADKWTNFNGNDDGIVQTEDEEEPESVQDFSSDVHLFSNNNRGHLEQIEADDDDFM